jgi:hypothetical protein
MRPTLAAAIAAAGAGSPQAHGSVPISPGRVLLADGDGLAYSCAGSDDTDPADAKSTMVLKLHNAKAACGAEKVLILLTHPASHKGYRYAVATVKQYQGQRSSGRRPKNWQYLRELLDSDTVFNGYAIERTKNAEADDLFGKYSTMWGVDRTVIFTHDKDMRMIPGIHLGWTDHRMVVLRDEFGIVRNDLQYGRKWFWLQMLHGDTADNIPGLPKYINDKGNPALIGEVTAGKVLAEAHTEDIARAIVFGLYKGWYGDEWRTQVLEQAVLLWMRRDLYSHWADVTLGTNPLGGVAELQVWGPAINTIAQRIKDIPVAQTQDD